MLKVVINTILSNLIIMKSNIEGIGTLEKPVGTLKILVHLHNNEKATVTNLIKEADLNQRTTYSALSKLLDEGLIYKEETKAFPVHKYYKLTEKGKKIAEHLGIVAAIFLNDESR